jgi:hypothetical protein
VSEAVRKSVPMSELISPFKLLPGYGMGGLIILLLYAVHSEIRFGSRARTLRTGPSVGALLPQVRSIVQAG